MLQKLKITDRLTNAIVGASCRGGNVFEKDFAYCTQEEWPALICIYSHPLRLLCHLKSEDNNGTHKSCGWERTREMGGGSILSRRLSCAVRNIT